MTQLITTVNMFAQLKVAALISGVSGLSLQQVKVVHIFRDMSGPMLYKNAKRLLTTSFSIRNTYLLSIDAKPDW